MYQSNQPRIKKETLPSCLAVGKAPGRPSLALAALAAA